MSGLKTRADEGGSAPCTGWGAASTGGGSGAGGGVKPVAVIIVNKDGVRLESVRRGAATIVEKVGEAVGHIIEKRGEKSA